MSCIRRLVMRGKQRSSGGGESSDWMLGEMYCSMLLFICLITYFGCFNERD